MDPMIKVEVDPEPVVDEGAPRRGRKRKYPSQNRQEKKICINNNRAYITSSGNLVEPKFFIDPACFCPRHCRERFQEPDLQRIFHNFHHLGSYEARTTFITQNVQEVPKKRCMSLAQESTKHFSRIYRINQTQVCKVFFLKLLQIAANRVDIALKKWKSCVLKDLRGRPMQLEPTKEQSGFNQAPVIFLQLNLNYFFLKIFF